MFRKLFGPSRKAIWTQLSEAVHGRYVDGGFWKGDRVEASHGEWMVTLDTYTVSTGKVTIVFTRMAAPYVNPSGFRFTIYRGSVFTSIAKFFGMQDIEVGDPSFDDAFIVKGTDEGLVRRLFANPKIRELIAGQPDLYLTVQDDEGWFGRKFPEGVDALHFHVAGIVKDVERLKLLYELFGETLEELCRMGAAYTDDPGVPPRS